MHGPMSGTDAAGAKRLIPEAWRRHKEFDNIHKLDGVAVITVQLRYNGWITEMQDSEKARTTSQVWFCVLFVSCFSLPIVCVVQVNFVKVDVHVNFVLVASLIMQLLCIELPTFSTPWSACVASGICQQQAASACVRLISNVVVYFCRAAQDWTICCTVQTQTSAALLTWQSRLQWTTTWKGKGPSCSVC